MSALSFITFSGVDETADARGLRRLADLPDVEFAVLIKPASAAGRASPRYPSPAWIDAFSAAHPRERLALHLCGDLAGLAVEAPEALAAALPAPIARRFARIQLNLKSVPRTDLALASLRRLAPLWGKPAFIVQVKLPDSDRLAVLLARLAAIDPFLGPGRIHALADPSGGLGLLPESRPPCLPGVFTGHAGGIAPANCAAEAAKAVRAAEAGGAETTWIDMESGIRTEDRFDVEKALSCFEAAAPMLAGVHAHGPAR